MSAPTYRFLSLGARVQSSALLLLAASGRIPRFDAASVTPSGSRAAVYAHLRRLTAIANTAGIEIVTVSAGNIRGSG